MPYGDRSYEWVAGVATFVVDPADGANAGIFDLGRCSANEDGKVRFDSDVRLLRPTAGGNGRALLTVPNRGMLGSLPFSVDAEFARDTHLAPVPGDGFLLEEGWTFAWCGWQWDVLRQHGGARLGGPAGRRSSLGGYGSSSVLTPHRTCIPSALRQRCCSSLSTRLLTLTTRTLSLRSVHHHSVKSTLCFAISGDSPTRPTSKWTAASRPSTGTNWSTAHRWRRLSAQGCSRFVISPLRSETHTTGSSRSASRNPGDSCGSSCSRASISTSADSRSSTVSSPTSRALGEASSIAGTGSHHSRSRSPPTMGPRTTLPGCSRACNVALGGVPKLILTNSAWEYWRGDGALVHQDARTGADLPEDRDARAHAARRNRPLRTFCHQGPCCPVANPVHHLEMTPVLRALFVQLVEWVCAGVAPASSCVPRQSDGTLVERAAVLRIFSDCAVPDPAHLPWTPAIDPASTAWPLELGEPMVALVSAVDPGGNEVAGIRLPHVAAPIAAYTGWNPRVHVDALPDVLYEMTGSRLLLQSSVAMPGRAKLRAGSADRGQHTRREPVSGSSATSSGRSEPAMRAYDEGRRVGNEDPAFFDHGAGALYLSARRTEHSSSRRGRISRRGGGPSRRRASTSRASSQTPATSRCR